MMEWQQIALLEQDRVRVEIQLSFLHGWEWSLRHYDGHRWGVVDSGLARAPQEAMARASSALLELAHGWEF